MAVDVMSDGDDVLTSPATVLDTVAPVPFIFPATVLVSIFPATVLVSIFPATVLFPLESIPSVVFPATVL